MSEIEYVWTSDSREKIDKARQQGTLGEFAKIPARIVKIEVREDPRHLNHLGTLVLTLEPEVHIKDTLELAANPNCRQCHGNGSICYWYAQDESRLAPCAACFPDSRKAVAEAERYAEFVQATKR